jgi:hypothetical protein
MAPKADKTPVKKVAKKGTSDKKKKRSKAETYKIYIYKVLKQVCHWHASTATHPAAAQTFIVPKSPCRTCHECSLELSIAAFGAHKH